MRLPKPMHTCGRMRKCSHVVTQKKMNKKKKNMSRVGTMPATACVFWLDTTFLVTWTSEYTCGWMAPIPHGWCAARARDQEHFAMTSRISASVFLNCRTRSQRSSAYVGSPVRKSRRGFQAGTACVFSSYRCLCISWKRRAIGLEYAQTYARICWKITDVDLSPPSKWKRTDRLGSCMDMYLMVNKWEKTWRPLCSSPSLS